MADNTVLDAGTGGDTIATDDVAGVKYQRVKLTDGTADSATTIASGGGVESAALRVTVASDSTGVLSVDDNGGSLTVDGTVAVSGTVTVDSELTTADLDTGAGTDTRAVVGLVLAKSGGAANISTSDPLPVTQQGTVTVQPSAGSMTVDDGGGSLTVDGTVSLGTANVTNAGTFAVQESQMVTDNAAFADGTTKVRPAGFILDETAGTALTENDAAAARIDSKRAQVLVIEDETTRGRRTTVTASNALKVDNSAVTQPISAASAIPVSDNSGSLTVDAPVGTPVFTTPTPSTTGGWSKVKYAAQTTTKQAVKASAGTFGGYYVYNPNATVAYIQVFDAASASVTVGTTAPDMIFGIPATGAANLEITNGVNMATAITLVCTTTATGSTAPGTGLDLTIFYK